MSAPGELEIEERCLAFRLDGRLCGVGLERSRAVVAGDEDATPCVGAEGRDGILWTGRCVPLLDLPRRQEGGRPAASRYKGPHLVVAVAFDDLAALPVSEVAGVLPVVLDPDRRVESFAGLDWKAARVVDSGEEILILDPFALIRALAERRR